MKENKFMYSKCPNCGRHGIPAFDKMGFKSTSVLTCIYCSKQFKASLFLATLVKFVILGLSVLSGVLYRKIPIINNVSLFLVLITFFILFLLAQYLLPVHQYKNVFSKVSSSSKYYHSKYTKKKRKKKK